MIAALAMLLIVYLPRLWILFLAAGIVGICEAFIYVSHLFYGVSGGKKRSGLMAIHEFLLSCGMVVGSVAGGYISDSMGRYMPYWLGAGSLVFGLAVQTAIWKKLKP
jgi:predicted MFS family arabinose efflux permease